MKLNLEIWLEEGGWAVRLDDQIVIWRWTTERLLNFVKMLLDAAQPPAQQKEE